MFLREPRLALQILSGNGPDCHRRTGETCKNNRRTTGMSGVGASGKGVSEKAIDHVFGRTYLNPWHHKHPMVWPVDSRWVWGSVTPRFVEPIIGTARAAIALRSPNP